MTALTKTRSGSHTARFTTFIRAHAGSDTHAARLLLPREQRASRLLHMLERVGLTTNRVMLRLPDALVARQRHFDRGLQAAMGSGCTQAVLLGAGFDSRPWRLPELVGKRVFIVDHPDTGRQRAYRADRAGLPPAGIQVDVDFRHDDLAAELAKAGFSAEQPTAWVWEGVCMYLTRDQADALLRQLHPLSAPGSKLLFDTWSPVESGLQHRYEGLGRMLLRRFGEPLRYHADEAAADHLCAETGWRIDDTRRCAAVDGHAGAHTALVLNTASVVPSP